MSTLLISSYTTYSDTNTMTVENYKINYKRLKYSLIGGIRYKWNNGTTLHLGLGTNWIYLLQRSLNDKELAISNLDKKWEYYPAFEVGLGWMFNL